MENEFVKEIPVSVYHVRGMPACSVHGCPNIAGTVLEVSVCNIDGDNLDGDECSDAVALVLCGTHRKAVASQMLDVLNRWGELKETRRGT